MDQASLDLEYNKILKLSVLAGRIMLESGGEIYRAEEMVPYIAKIYGAKDCQCYATPGMITVSLIGDDDKAYTVMRLIRPNQTDLSKVDKLNDFSRSLASNIPDILEAENHLRGIEATAAYKGIVMVLACALAAGSFAIAFAGDIQDMICATVAGGILRVLVSFLNQSKLNPFFVNLIGGMISAFFGTMSARIGIGTHGDIITISILMLLVPGLMMTNAIRDIAAGDMVSGTNRSIEAIFIAAALGAGAGLVYNFLG